MEKTRQKKKHLSRQVEYVTLCSATGSRRTAQILLAQFSIFYSNFSQTLLRGSSATCVVFEMFRKRKQRASQAAAAAGAAGVAYAPHTLLELSKQLLLCSKNCTSLSRDTMKHPPVFRDAKSARTPKLCGRQVYLRCR